MPRADRARTRSALLSSFSPLADESTDLDDCQGDCHAGFTHSTSLRTGLRRCEILRLRLKMTPPSCHCKHLKGAWQSQPTTATSGLLRLTKVSLAMTKGRSLMNWTSTFLNSVDQDGDVPDGPYYSG
ncbi:MAG TPA: hypothetical protein VMW50_09905 [Dehalococcoidia bacterium]|nr:hypothetical protein [Dehalococcoidia bacterium]